MNEISISISLSARKLGVPIQAAASYGVSMDEGMKVLVHEVQTVGTAPEAIAYGDVGIVHESWLYLRNMDETNTVHVRRSDVDYGASMKPGESYGPIRIDGPCLNVTRLMSSAGTANVEVWIAQTTEVIV